MAKLSIVVPAHNEEGNLPTLVQNLQVLIHSEKLDAQIVLVDDNSTDSTPFVCDALAKKHRNMLAIHRRGNPGMGAALKEGTRKASGEIIVWVMADLADDLNTIPRFIEKIDKGADIVVGSRYIEGGKSDLPFPKKQLSRGYATCCRFLVGTQIHDLTNAFRAFRKKVFLNVPLEYDNFAISPEIAIKAHQKGYVLAEVATKYANRKKGEAKFRINRMGPPYIAVLATAVIRKYLPFLQR